MTDIARNNLNFNGKDQKPDDQVNE